MGSQPGESEELEFRSPVILPITYLLPVQLEPEKDRNNLLTNNVGVELMVAVQPNRGGGQRSPFSHSVLIRIPVRLFS